jgi:hypothetical protein
MTKNINYNSFTGILFATETVVGGYFLLIPVMIGACIIAGGDAFGPGNRSEEDKNKRLFISFAIIISSLLLYAKVTSDAYNIGDKYKFTPIIFPIIILILCICSRSGLHTSSQVIIQSDLPTSQNSLPTSQNSLPTSQSGQATSQSGQATSQSGQATSQNSLPTSQSGSS